MTRKIWGKFLEQWKNVVRKTKAQLDKLQAHDGNQGQVPQM